MRSSESDRRQFLSAVIAIAAAAGAGCAGSDNGSSAGSGNNSGSTSTSAPGTKGSTTTGPLPEVPALTANPFTLGVASGDPDHESMVLWTRLAMDPARGDGAMPTEDIPVRWEVSTDDSFSKLAAWGDAKAVATFAHSVHVTTESLTPDTWYWYRFRVGSYTSPAGRTRTMPKSDASPQSLRFAFASCQDYQEGFYSAYRAMAADELDLVFFLGDYIYENGTATGSARTVPGGETITLDEYRVRYATYKTDAHLQAAHARAPWIVTWDDHEVENNYADLVNDEGLDEEAFTARRAAAYQAYYEHQPLRLDPPKGADWKIYRQVAFGTLAEFFVLDGRQYRSDQPCDSRLDAIVPKDSCPELASDDRTMLGEEQETWLHDGLIASKATWKALAQQTVMSSLQLANIVLNVDQWDGYADARKRLLSIVSDNKIENFVVLTGDIHSAGAGVLTVDGTPATAAVGVEFVGTSITSKGLTDIVPGGSEFLKPENLPGIAYLNLKDHGYTRCIVTPTSWVTDYVMVESTATDDSPTRVDASFTVAPGNPTLTRQ